MFKKKCQFLKNDGFSLIEILVVIGIMMGFLGYLFSNMSKNQEKARAGMNEMKMNSISASINIFNAKKMRYPTTEEGLQILVDQSNLTEKDLLDAWGVPYGYQLVSPNKYIICSTGSGKTVVAPEGAVENPESFECNNN